MQIEEWGIFCVAICVVPNIQAGDHSFSSVYWPAMLHSPKTVNHTGDSPPREQEGKCTKVLSNLDKDNESQLSTINMYIWT